MLGPVSGGWVVFLMSNVVTSRGWFNIGRVAVNTEPCSARTRFTMSFITKPITIIIRFNIIISKTFDIIISGLFSWHMLYPPVGGSQAVWPELRSSLSAHTRVIVPALTQRDTCHLSPGSEACHGPAVQTQYVLSGAAGVGASEDILSPAIKSPEMKLL